MRTHLIDMRRGRNMTQAELADAVGLSRKTISALERGRLNGSIKTWEALSALFKTPIADLREGGDVSARKKAVAGWAER